MANKYVDTKDDKPGYPKLPIHIAKNELVLEDAFTYCLTMILTKKRIGQEDVTKINSILMKKPIVFEGGRVDFEDTDNMKTIDTLVSEVWKEVKRVLMREIASQDFHRGFTLKQIK